MSLTSEVQRRYTRIQLVDLGAVSSLLGVEVHWPEAEVTRVLDLSYAGAALERPQQPLENGQNLDLKFVFNKVTVPVTAKVVWFNDRLVGCEFFNLSLQTQKAMDDLLAAPLVGANLKPVDQKYFAAQDDFQFWYAGPQGCHVFLWTSRQTLPSSVNKALIQFNDQNFVFENGVLKQGSQPASQKEIQMVVQLLSQIHDSDAPLSHLIEQLAKTL